MTDEYATLRAAAHAGATIQAFTLHPHFECDGGVVARQFIHEHAGYWRDLPRDVEPKFSCHPTRYRVKDERPFVLTAMDSAACGLYALMEESDDDIGREYWAKKHADMEAARALVADLIVANRKFQRVYHMMSEDPDFAALFTALARTGGSPLKPDTVEQVFSP